MDVNNSFLILGNDTRTDSLPYNLTERYSTETVYPEEKLPQGIIITFNIIAAVVVIVNSGHLSVICNQPRLQKPQYYNYKLFLVILAAMDLSLGIVRLVLSNDFMQDLLIKYNILCTITAVYLHITYASMISIIVMVSIDRAYCLKQSVTYQSRQFVKRYPKIIIAVISFFTVIYTTVGILFHDRGFSTKDVGTCNFGSKEIPILAAPTVLLIFVYLLVITGVYIYIIILTKIHISSHRNAKENKRITEVTKTIGGLIVGSALCWLPPITSAVLWGVGIPCVELEIFALVMLELNSVANPLLYGLANTTYRSLVYHKLSRCFRFCRDSKDQELSSASQSRTLNSSSTASSNL